MGHPQLSTPMQMNNPTMENIANKKTQQKRTKDMDIHFYWVHDIIHKGYYNIFSIPGKLIRPIISLKTIHLIIIDKWTQCISTVQKIQLMQVQGCVIQYITPDISTTGG